MNVRGWKRWPSSIANQLWRLDGQLSCVDWLMWRTRMARATAYEKLRIAHELRRRPAVRAAFADGRLSYSAARVITRIDGPDPEVDERLIDLALAGTISDLERVVRFYQLHQDQHRPPPDPTQCRGVRFQRGLDGTTTIEIVLETTEAEELAAGIQAYIDLRAVDESPQGDSVAPIDEPNWAAKRADAFMDLVRTGLAHADAGHAVGADRYLVHLVQRAESIELVDGTPVDACVAARVACDCSTLVHQIGDDGEPLRLGRKTREWNTAQRRCIQVRDGGRCRFPGCHHRYVDIHHLHWWTKGGMTDIDNGLLICPRHHTLLHGGFTAAGNANRQVTFHRPNGTPLGSSTPRSG